MEPTVKPMELTGSLMEPTLSPAQCGDRNKQKTDRAKLRKEECIRSQTHAILTVSTHITYSIYAHWDKRVMISHHSHPIIKSVHIFRKGWARYCCQPGYNSFGGQRKDSFHIFIFVCWHGTPYVILSLLMCVPALSLDAVWRSLWARHVMTVWQVALP